MKYPLLHLTPKQVSKVKNFNKDKEIKLEFLNCVICNMQNFKKLYSNDRYGINQQTVLCNNCGLVYSNPRMSEATLKYFYSSNLYREIYESASDFEQNFQEREADIKKNNSNFNPDFNKYYPKLFFDFINSLNIDYKSVCEIGAGFGNYLIYFKKIGKHVCGIEPSKVLSSIAKNNNIDVKQGFLNDLNSNYDLIILRHVFEHLYNPLKDLKKIRDHTNKYLFLEVPGNIKRLASIQNAHNFYFTKNTLNKIVLNAGFDLVSIRHCIETEFIFALYRKNENENIKFGYSYSKELKFINNTYRNDNIRFFIIRLLKMFKLFNFFIKIKKIV